MRSPCKSAKNDWVKYLFLHGNTKGEKMGKVMRSGEQLYNMAPVWLQNVLVSMMGMKLYNERYLGIYRKYLSGLIASQWLSESDILLNQFNKFKKLIEYSYYNVPYYTKLFNKNSIHPFDINSIDDIRKIPLLTKDIIRLHNDELISSAIDVRRALVLNTSGTTGKPLTVYVDKESRRKEYAFIARSQIWAGLENGRQNVTFSGRLIVPKNNDNVFWRYNAIMNNWHFSSYHLSDENLPVYIAKMLKIKPKFIDSYPSNLYILAKYMEKKSITGIYPKAILTTAETLFGYQRELIEKVFKCSVFDQYGCTEQCCFISQCEEGNYHIHPEYGIVELLDENDKEVNSGEEGRIVCTGFVNQAMPLIRYDIGDIAIKGGNNCSCGRKFPLIHSVVGRFDDYIVTPEGKKVGRLDPAFKGVENIKNAQIIQDAIDHILIKIIPDKKYSDNDGKKLIKGLSQRLGKSINYSLKLVTSIPKTKGGKFKSVISNI
jgi:phenylacetate-CoA ligase